MNSKIEGGALFCAKSQARMRLRYAVINLDWRGIVPAAVGAMFRIGHPAVPREDVGFRRWLAWIAGGAVFWLRRRLTKIEGRLHEYAIGRGWSRY